VNDLVAFYSDGLALGFAQIVNNGGQMQASFAASALSRGAHPLSASYVGNTAAGSSSSVPIVQVVH
jgi:hypothetical protein